MEIRINGWKYLKSKKATKFMKSILPDVKGAYIEVDSTENRLKPYKDVSIENGDQTMSIGSGTIVVIFKNRDPIILMGSAWSFIKKIKSKDITYV